MSLEFLPDCLHEFCGASIVTVANYINVWITSEIRNYFVGLNIKAYHVSKSR
jgi:hypothetical protein